MPRLAQSSSHDTGLQLVARAQRTAADRPILPARAVDDFAALQGPRKLDRLRKIYGLPPTAALEVVLEGIIHELRRIRGPRSTSASTQGRMAA